MIVKFIAEYVADSIAGYIAGGMRPETAAGSARGEVLAIYKGNRWTRNGAGEFVIMLPPEALTVDEAGRQCDTAINAFLQGGRQAVENLTLSRKQETPVPMTGTNKKTGLEGLKNYTRRKTA